MKTLVITGVAAVALVLALGLLTDSPASPPLNRQPLSVAASGSCPEDSLSESEAHQRALAYASAEGFQNALVTESRLATLDDLQENYYISPSHISACYWYVAMSGLKVNDHWPPGMPATPTPGPRNTFTEMIVVLDSVSGYLASKGLSTDPLFTPEPPTPGPWPTMLPPPTLPPLFPTPPL